MIYVYIHTDSLSAGCETFGCSGLIYGEGFPVWDYASAHHALHDYANLPDVSCGTVFWVANRGVDKIVKKLGLLFLIEFNEMMGLFENLLLPMAVVRHKDGRVW